MTGPSGIIPTAVYSPEQARDALGIGEAKLRDLVQSGRLHPLDFHPRWRFLGEELVRLCREASGLRAGGAS